MTDDVSIYLQQMNKIHDEPEKGFHYVRMVAMRTHAEGLIRAINKQIGGTVYYGGRQSGKTAMMEELKVVMNENYMKCPHCDWHTPHGMQGLRSHISKKHKNV